MTKISLNILLLTLILATTSCKKELDSLIELEADYKVIDLEYGFDNFMRNINSEQLIIKQRNIVLIYVDKNGKTTIEDNIIPDSLIIS